MGRDAGGFAGELTDAAQQLRPWAQVHLAEINEPILPIDELGIVGAPPTWKLATDEAIPTLSMMVGRGPTKPQDVKVTDDGELLVAPTQPNLKSAGGSVTPSSGSAKTGEIALPGVPVINNVYSLHVSATGAVTVAGNLAVGVGNVNGGQYQQLRNYAVGPNQQGINDSFQPLSPLTVTLTESGGVQLALVVKWSGLGATDGLTVAMDIYYD